MTPSRPRTIAAEPARPTAQSMTPRWRILLLLRNREDRRLLAEWLAPRYQVIAAESDAALSGPFDLCIIDGVSLDAIGPRVRARKRSERHASLPVLLVTPLKSVGMMTHHLWESVDELILSPIQKVELEARIEILLRARELSLQN